MLMLSSIIFIQQNKVFVLLQVKNIIKMFTYILLHCLKCYVEMFLLTVHHSKRQGKFNFSYECLIECMFSEKKGLCNRLRNNGTQSGRKNKIAELSLNDTFPS